MSAVAGNLARLRERIAAACASADRDVGEVTLLAVSKKHGADLVREAHAAGQLDFGENRVQELVAKAPELADIGGLRWHMIGSLQTNKVRDLLRVGGLALVHSLDRVGLGDALQRELARGDRRLDALLQINATGEDQKHGCPPDAAEALLRHVQGQCPNVTVVGLMAMGPLQGDPAPVFRRVATLQAELSARCGVPLPTLSLGMTGDLEAAIAAGSTLLRIGTAVFGPRS